MDPVDLTIEQQQLAWSDGEPEVAARVRLPLSASDVADLHQLEEVNAVPLPGTTRFRYVLSTGFAFLRVDGYWVRTF